MSLTTSDDGFAKVGLDVLLTPENCAVLPIDDQPSQLAWELENEAKHAGGQ
jgi:hypothetical protein